MSGAVASRSNHLSPVAQSESPLGQTWVPQPRAQLAASHKGEPSSWSDQKRKQAAKIRGLHLLEDPNAGILVLLLACDSRALKSKYVEWNP